MTSVNLKKLDNMLDEALEKETKESLNQWLSEKDTEETVIQGWVAKDNDSQELYLYSSVPTRMINMWNGHGSLLMPLDAKLYPDLTWGDDPQEVEIIIKRKKNG